MADVFEEREELLEPRERLFEMIEETPWLDWLVLTKRPEAMADFMRPFYWGDYKVLPNLWLGATIESARYTYRADILREIPAAVRFISAEPLLGSLFDWKRDVRPQTCEITGGYGPLDLTGIDWVIAGAESGPKRRPMELDWVRELRDACLCPDCGGEGWTQETGHEDRCWETGDCQCSGVPIQESCDPCGSRGTRVAFFFKQAFIDGRKVECPELDGRTWAEFPATPSSPEAER
jgi:protein gp37